MIDIQDHIRNQGALNLFDGKGVKANTFTGRQTISPTEGGKVEHIVFWWDRDRWQYIAQRGPEWRYISEGALCFNPFDKSKFWRAAPLPNGVIRDIERWQ